MVLELTLAFGSEFGKKRHAFPARVSQRGPHVSTDRARATGTKRDAQATERDRAEAELLPELEERAVAPTHGVGCRQRDRADVFEHVVVLGGVPAAKVPLHPAGVGADNQQIIA
jgi:hypothetical protein